MDQDLVNGYLKRKDNKGSCYNFDLYEMINKFSFYDFCDAVKRKDIDNNGACLVITDNQYVLSYNSSFGRGTHEGTFARIIKELYGGGEITNENDAWVLYKKCEKEYITARITYEAGINSLPFRPSFEGRIAFNFIRNIKENKNMTITNGMLESFKSFYNTYNSEIEYVCNKFNFKVVFSYIKDNKVIKDSSNNLDNLYNFIASLLDENKNVNEEESIIGISNNFLKK